MGKLIAVAGKGGTGKTTVASFIVRHMIDTGRKPVFAVDADPNFTLGDALGIKVEKTIGILREEFFSERAKMPAGMPKELFLEQQMHAAVHDSQGFDLLVMGRQEGPGCYCMLNNVLRKFIDTMSADYRWVVVDNEAGMEHLSRRTTRKIDLLLAVCDHSVKAARAVGRISELADELKLQVGRRAVLLNRAPREIAEDVRAEIGRSGVPFLGALPEDDAVRAADAKGRPLWEDSGVSPAREALARIIEPVLIGM